MEPERVKLEVGARRTMQDKTSQQGHEAGRGKALPDLGKLLEEARFYRSIGRRDRAEKLYEQIVESLHPPVEESGHKRPAGRERKDH